MDTGSGKTSAEYQLQVATHARTVMAECNRALVRASDENQLLLDMCRVVVASGRYRTAWIGMVDHDAASTIRPVASAGDASGHLTTTRVSWGDNEFGQGPGGIAVRTRKPHAVRRIDSDPYFATQRRNTLALGYRSAAALPLLVGEEAIGIIGILAEDPDAFDRDEVALLEELANDIAFGLSTLRLRATQRRANQLQELEHSAAHCLAQSENVAEAMAAVIRAICESENWEVGRYFRVDQAARDLRLEHAWHIPEPGFAQFIERSRDMRYSRGFGLAGLVWESGEPLWSPDRNNDPRALRTHSIDIGLKASFVFPVTSGAQTIGVLSFSTREPRDPDEGLLKAVRALGSQIGQFLRRKEAEAVLRESEARFPQPHQPVVRLVLGTGQRVSLRTDHRRHRPEDRRELRVPHRKTALGARRAQHERGGLGRASRGDRSASTLSRPGAVPARPRRPVELDDHQRRADLRRRGAVQGLPRHRQGHHCAQGNRGKDPRPGSAAAPACRSSASRRWRATSSWTCSTGPWSSFRERCAPTIAA
jgi:GAF domain-containing protein